MLFVNTRPDDRAQALTQCFEQSNFTVINLPLLELQPKGFDQRLKNLFLDLKTAQIVVVVSPTAVEIGMMYLAQSGLQLSDLNNLQWVAVGKKTAEELSKYGITSHIPEVETSEGMLSLPLFKNLNKGEKVAFWRGEGGRQFMMQQLQQQGQVLNFVLYQRDCPENAQQNFIQFVNKATEIQPPYWVCISSEASWKNWLALFDRDYVLLDHCHILVLGERLYKLLDDEKQRLHLSYKLTRVDDLDPYSMLHTIKNLIKVL